MLEPMDKKPGIDFDNLAFEGSSGLGVSGGPGKSVLFSRIHGTFT